MVWFSEVGQFMDDEVIENFWRRHAQTPVEGQVAPTRASAPFCPLPHDVDTAGFLPQLPRTYMKTFRDGLPSLSAEPCLQSRVQVHTIPSGYRDDDAPSSWLVSAWGRQVSSSSTSTRVGTPRYRMDSGANSFCGWLETVG